MMDTLQKPRTKVKLDFSQTKRMFPGGMLLLIAYVELLLDFHPGRIVARCTPHSLPAQLMRHLGIARKLGVRPISSHKTHESVLGWKYLTGTVAEGQKILDLIEDYRKLTTADIPEGLYEALTEALTNVRQHAYPEHAKVPHVLQRWWLFAKYREPSGSDDGNLYIGVYDIGIGIQSSMKQHLQPTEKLMDATGGWLSVVGLKPTMLDRLLLQAAVERNRSSTGLANRGNGLPEMRDFVLGTTSGRLSIISGHAQYSCSASAPSVPATHSPERFHGTLILWSIPLKAKERS